jgi:hypothetical protein
VEDITISFETGALYTNNGEAIEFDIKHRYKVLKEVIDETSNKALIFVPFKHVIDILTEKTTVCRTWGYTNCRRYRGMVGTDTFIGDVCTSQRSGT